MPLKLEGGLPIHTTGARSAERVLDVPWVGQYPQRLWCWAACAAMLRRYYFRDPRPIEACEVVAAFEGLANGHPCAKPADFDHPIADTQVSKVLLSVGIGCSNAPQAPLTRERLRAEIDAGRPLLVVAQSEPCDQPPQSTRHLFIVRGWTQPDQGDLCVRLQDPADPNRAGELWTFSALEKFCDWGCWTGAWTDVRAEGVV